MRATELPLLPTPTTDAFGRSLDYLQARQDELEADTLAAAVEQFKKQVERRVRHYIGPPETNLLEWSVMKMASAVQDFLAREAAKVRGRKYASTKFIRLMGPEQTALLTAEAIFNSISGIRIEASTLERRIAEHILTRLNCGVLLTAEGFYERQLMANAAKRAIKAGIPWTDAVSDDLNELILDKGEQQLLGVRCLELFIEATGFNRTARKGVLLSIKNVRRQERQDTFVVPTQRMLRYVLKHGAGTITPQNMPSVIEPKPWTGIDRGGRGGYWPTATTRRRTNKLVRNKKNLDYLKGADLSIVFHAMNVLQGTPWLVNEAVFREQEHLLPELTHVEEKPLPSKPRDLIAIPWKERTPEQKAIVRKYWQRVREINNENQSKWSKANALQRTASVARTLLRCVDANDGKPLPFYFPHNLDFRGRAYPLTTFLSPQGSDVHKGLLMFAKGKPLGTPEAVRRLALHGASCLGTTPEEKVKMSQRSMDWRAEWIENNSDFICRIADDPRTNRGWMDADEPFQFLAFCFEWRGYKRAGLAFVSHLPVGMDCSCNGLQLYSALLRDEQMAESVNLRMSSTADVPGDIYEAVREKIEPLLREDADNGNDYARAWLQWNGITRKMVKPIVMTLPYAATPYRAAAQLQEYLLKLGSKRPEFIPEGGFEDPGKSRHLRYLSLLIRNRILADVAAPAVKCMDWFKWLSTVVLAGQVPGKPILWNVPETGFVVEQHYHEPVREKIQTTLLGARHEPSYRIYDTDRVDKSHHSTAIAPNLIHSLDAAIMMTTVSKAKRAGIDSIAAVHDCYSTHAADAETLNEQLRLAFVALFAHQDVLDCLEQALLANVASDELRAFTAHYRAGQRLTEDHRALLARHGIDLDKHPPVAKPTPGRLEIAEVVMSNLAM